MKYSDTPWDINVASNDIYDSGGDYVAAAFSDENAAFIVKACNNHERLASTLQDLIYTSEHLWADVKPIKDTSAMTVTHPIIEAAKQALLAAEEG